MFKLVIEEAEEPEIKLPTSAGSQRKQESSRKNIYFCFIDYAKAFDCVDHNKLRKMVGEGPAHLSPQRTPLLWTPGPRAPPEPTILILSALGKACFLLPKGCGTSVAGSPGRLRGLGPEYQEDGCAPTGGPEPAGCPGRRAGAARVGVCSPQRPPLSRVLTLPV